MLQSLFWRIARYLPLFPSLRNVWNNPFALLLSLFWLIYIFKNILKIRIQSRFSRIHDNFLWFRSGTAFQMKHASDFLVLNNFGSPITKNPRDFFYSRRFFLIGFFSFPFQLNFLSLFKIRRFLKKWFEHFLFQ